MEPEITKYHHFQASSVFLTGNDHKPHNYQERHFVYRQGNTVLFLIVIVIRTRTELDFGIRC